MQIDHIIIFSNDQGEKADELVNFGLTEGSKRIHEGQGTRNRKFYFENVFLEIVWVHNEDELRSELTAPTRLWDRASHRLNGCSPFGLCLVNSADTDELFEGCLKYRPGYLPAGFSSDIITNEEYPYLPWTCRLPSTTKYTMQEPKFHQVGINKLTYVKFGIRKAEYQNRFTNLLGGVAMICFREAENHHLTLEFDHKRTGSVKKFRDLPLAIEY